MYKYDTINTTSCQLLKSFIDKVGGKVYKFEIIRNVMSCRVTINTKFLPM